MAHIHRIRRLNEERDKHKKAMSERECLRVGTQNLVNQKDTNDDLESEEQPGTPDADSTSRECPILRTLDVRINIVVENIINGHDLRSKMRLEDGFGSLNSPSI